MEPVSPAYLPRTRIPPVRVPITSKYIIEQSLQFLGIGSCETTTHDFLDDEIIAAVYFEVPPHGDYSFPKKEKFYGEPCHTRDEAIESPHDSALRYLQREDVVFINDANLQELTETKRSLLRATTWADAFEMKCTSQEAEISSIAEQNRVMQEKSPLYVSGDCVMNKEVVLHHAPLPSANISGDNIHRTLDSSPASKPCISMVATTKQPTPLHAKIISENLLATRSKGLKRIAYDDASVRNKDGVPRTKARRALFAKHAGTCSK